MKYASVKGMEDILPQDIRVWQGLERIARIELESNGYREIRTPLLEDTNIFVRSIGETTDIVTKEMYTFSDRKGRSLTLRPEGTAPIVRAYIEHNLGKILSESKLYYIGPMFRSERPQKGRSRQFHQIGVEVIGSYSHFTDAEVIMQLDRMLKGFGLDNFTIKLNSLGCKADKDTYSEELKKYLKDKKAQLCDDCKARIEKNVLRVLDCKNDSCMSVVRGAPDTVSSLCRACEDHFEKVKGTLRKLKIDFKQTANLVRGLDYYTGLVFEVTHPFLGGQDALGAGGRYDNLVRDMGGPDVGAVGYAIGMERVIISLGGGIERYTKPAVIYIATLGDEARIKGLMLADEIKMKLNYAYDKNVSTHIGADGSSLKSQMRSADRLGARYVLIIGEDEIKKGEAVLRDMNTKDQSQVRFGDLIIRLKELLQ